MLLLVFVKICELVLKLKEKHVQREHDDFLSMSFPTNINVRYRLKNLSVPMISGGNDLGEL
jgi:hypothetical protein